MRFTNLAVNLIPDLLRQRACFIVKFVLVRLQFSNYAAPIADVGKVLSTMFRENPPGWLEDFTE